MTGIGLPIVVQAVGTASPGPYIQPGAVLVSPRGYFLRDANNEWQRLDYPQLETELRRMGVKV